MLRKSVASISLSLSLSLSLSVSCMRKILRFCRRFHGAFPAGEKSITERMRNLILGIAPCHKRQCSLLAFKSRHTFQIAAGARSSSVCAQSARTSYFAREARNEKRLTAVSFGRQVTTNVVTPPFFPQPCACACRCSRHAPEREARDQR